MNDIEKRARELLAAEYDKAGSWFAAQCLREEDPQWSDRAALRAIIAALTPPEGYVMIRVLDARRVLKGNPSIGGYDLSLNRIAAALAARPEVSR